MFDKVFCCAGKVWERKKADLSHPTSSMGMTKQTEKEDMHHCHSNCDNKLIQIYYVVCGVYDFSMT